MNIKQFIEFLQTLPQDATVQVLSHSRGYDYHDQGGWCTVDDFTDDPLWDSTESEGWKYGKHFELTTDSTGQVFLQLGVMDK